MPFVIVRIGTAATASRIVDDAVTSHVDVVPTLVAATGADVDALAAQLNSTFTTVHPLPGADLLSVVDGGSTAPLADRTVYLITRDNILEATPARRRWPERSGWVPCRRPRCLCNSSRQPRTWRRS